MQQDRLVDATLLAAIFGTLDRKAWANDTEDIPDPYSLFTDHALAMGWSTAGPGGLASNLWEMNEASTLRAIGTQGPDKPLAWFQVGLPDTRQARPLPLVPLVKNSWEATSRFGVPHISAVQILAPLWMGGPADRYLYSATGWFDAVDPTDRVDARVTLDVGDGPSTTEILDILTTIPEKLPVTGFSFGLDNVEFAATSRPASDFSILRMGASRNTATFSARLPDWTAESVGWTVAIVVECCRMANLRTSGLITVDIAR